MKHGFRILDKVVPTAGPYRGDRCEVVEVTEDAVFVRSLSRVGVDRVQFDPKQLVRGERWDG